MVNNFVRVLKNLGLSEMAAELYVALFELGHGTIQDIARQAGLHRTQIYRHIPLMLEDGIITEILDGKRKHYIPNAPNRILASYEKKRDAQIAMMTEMQRLYDERDTHSSILYKKGRAGIEEFYYDVVDTLPRGGVFYRITTEKDTEHINQTYIPPHYKERRDEKEIERLIIMSESNAKKKTKKLEREIHTLPDDRVLFDDDISFTIYGDKVAYVDFTKELSIIIEDATIAEFHKKLFRILYDSLV